MGALCPRLGFVARVLLVGHLPKNGVKGAIPREGVE